MNTGSLKINERTRTAGDCRQSWLELCWFGWNAGINARPLRTAIGGTRRAMTLIELLVVIVILTTVVAAAIPILAPADDDRRLREASRGLNTFITGAQARAIALNRPVGIGLKRLSQDTGRAEDRGVCLEAFYIEQPLPYAGFDTNSRVCLAIHPNPAFAGTVLVRFVARGATAPQLPAGWANDLFPEQMIRPGDVIETGGTRFELLLPVRNDGSNIRMNDSGFFRPPQKDTPTIVARPLTDTGRQLSSKYDSNGAEVGFGKKSKAPFWTNPSPYRILRQAMPTSDEPYQLPEGAAIDLRASGLGDNDYFYWPGEHDNDQPVLVLFSPNGNVSRLRYWQTPAAALGHEVFDAPVSDNLYLLVGKRENIPPSVTNDATLVASEWAKAETVEQRDKLRESINWLLPTSRWVVIGSQSGRIVSVENAAVDLKELFGLGAFAASSENMRAAQIIAAREFAREMVQMGGR